MRDLAKVPKNWAEVSFEDVYTLHYGKALIKKSRTEGGTYPVLGSSGVIGTHAEFLVEGPAIIVGRKGSAGSVIYCKQNFWPIDTVYFVKPLDGIETTFAYYHLQSLYLHALEKSTAIPGLSRDDAYALKVAIPPLHEQRRIVAKIEELFSELDKGIEALSTAHEQLKAYRQAVLKYAFEGRQTGMSHDGNSPWPERRLGELIEFLTSGSRGWADYYSDRGDLFIRAQNLKHDRLDLSEIAFVRLPEGETEGVRTRVQLGDVLITITGANVTKTGLVDRALGTAYVSQHVALCRLAENLLPEFLYWYLLSESGGRLQLNELAYGAGKPGLNLDNIRSVSIPVPSVAKQRAVVSFITAALESEERLRTDVSTAEGQAEALRQSILKQAFSGQLVAQEAKDEPASVLLECIRAERETVNKLKPARKTKKTKSRKEVVA